MTTFKKTVVVLGGPVAPAQLLMCVAMSRVQAKRNHLADTVFGCIYGVVVGGLLYKSDLENLIVTFLKIINDS